LRYKLLTFSEGIVVRQQEVQGGVQYRREEPRVDKQWEPEIIILDELRSKPKW